MEYREVQLLEGIVTALERIADCLESVRGENIAGEGFWKVVVGDRGQTDVPSGT